MSRKVLALSVPTAIILIFVAIAPIAIFHWLYSVTLQSPQALWLLILLIPLLLLYMLKQQQAAITVSTLKFWAEVQRELEASTPFKQLQRRLLLLIQIFLLVLCVYAACDPVRIANSAPKTMVVVIDTSASMATRERRNTRLELAINKVESLIDGMTQSEEMILIAAGIKARTIQTASSQRGLLRRALRGLKVEAGVAALDDALSLAAGQLKAGSEADFGLIVVSDGTTPIINSQLSIQAKTRFLKIGESSDNIGIVRIQTADPQEAANDPWVLVKIQNFSPNDRELQCLLDQSGKILALRRLKLKPKEIRTLIFRLSNKSLG